VASAKVIQLIIRRHCFSPLSVKKKIYNVLTLYIVSVNKAIRKYDQLSTRYNRQFSCRYTRWQITVYR